jgi:heptosyltransferase-2
VTDAVVVQTAFLGDVILTTPLLTALARRHGPVDVVTTPEAAPLLETHPAVSEVVPFDKRGAMRGLRGVIRFATVLRRRAYRVAYLPQGSRRSALTARLAGIPQRVGFDDGAGRWWYTERRPRLGRHECQRLLGLAGATGDSIPTLVLTDDDRRIAAAALAAAGVHRPFAVLAPGSARATKRWPHYDALAARLARQMTVVIVGAPADRLVHGVPGSQPGGGESDPFTHPIADLTGSLTLRQSAAVLALADIAVTNDSAALHLAQAVRTPVVAIFGPTVPSQGFGPRGPHDQIAALDGLACRPCGTHGASRCPLGHHRCMRELGVETVAAVTERVLASATVPRHDGGRTPTLHHSTAERQGA